MRLTKSMATQPASVLPGVLIQLAAIIYKQIESKNRIVSQFVLNEVHLLYSKLYKNDCMALTTVKSKRLQQQHF